MQTSPMPSSILFLSSTSLGPSLACLTGVNFSTRSSVIGTCCSIQIFSASQYCQKQWTPRLYQIQNKARHINIQTSNISLTFLPTANRSTALSNWLLSMKKSAQRWSSSGSVFSSRSSDTIWRAANCLVWKAKSKALEKYPAWQNTQRLVWGYTQIAQLINHYLLVPCGKAWQLCPGVPAWIHKIEQPPPYLPVGSTMQDSSVDLPCHAPIEPW